MLLVASTTMTQDTRVRQSLADLSPWLRLTKGHAPGRTSAQESTVDRGRTCMHDSWRLRTSLRAFLTEGLHAWHARSAQHAVRRMLTRTRNVARLSRWLRTCNSMPSVVFTAGSLGHSQHFEFALGLTLRFALPHPDESRSRCMDGLQELSIKASPCCTHQL
jgi:hypothetical protein